MASVERHAATLETLRRYLFLILLLSLAGTGGELLLVGHNEDAWQWVPLILIPLTMLLLAWLMAAPGTMALRAWRGLMALLMLSGLLGLSLHWKGKMEFKQESDPSLSGWKLFWASMESQTPPALAPGVMIPLGLLGLACAFRHPASSTSKNASNDTGENK